MAKRIVPTAKLRIVFDWFFPVVRTKAIKNANQKIEVMVFYTSVMGDLYCTLQYSNFLVISATGRPCSLPRSRFLVSSRNAPPAVLIFLTFLNLLELYLRCSWVQPSPWTAS